ELEAHRLMVGRHTCKCRLLCRNGTFRHSGWLAFPRVRKLSLEARERVAAWSRDAMQRRIQAGIYSQPTKDPVVAAKFRSVHLMSVKEVRWKHPPPPDWDPATGRWTS